MKVSVIIPVYNVEDYLKECIESLTAQTIKDIEILLVDDGSKDKSGVICDEYSEKYENVKVIHKVNGGQASARNMALDIAEGEFIGFVDSDDWVDADMYMSMVESAEENNSDIVICDMVDHFPDKTIYHHSSEYDDVFKVTPSACNKLFRRSLIGDTKFPEGLWYEDFEFTTKQLLKTKNISNIHKGFYHCHCREVSTMFNDNSKKNLDIVTVINNLKVYMEDNGYDKEYKNLLEYLMIDHILITSINRVALHKNSDKKAVIKTMRNYVKESFPNFKNDRVFKEMPRNRRIVARLNAAGLENVSKILLELKQKVR